MSALINRAFPLIESSAQGPRVYGRGPSSLMTRVRLIKISRESTRNAGVRFFGRHVLFAAEAAAQQVEAARLDAAIAPNLKELGYGG